MTMERNPILQTGIIIPGTRSHIQTGDNVALNGQNGSKSRAQGVLLYSTPSTDAWTLLVAVVWLPVYNGMVL